MSNLIKLFKPQSTEDTSNKTKSFQSARFSRVPPKCDNRRQSTVSMVPLMFCLIGGMHRPLVNDSSSSMTPSTLSRPTRTSIHYTNQTASQLINLQSHTHTHTVDYSVKKTPDTSWNQSPTTTSFWVRTPLLVQEFCQ